jgi:hypothetical protein
MGEFEQRWPRRALLLASAGALMAACTNSWASNNLYSIGVRGEGNAVEVVPLELAKSDRLRIEIMSARGIGEATVAWWSIPAPSTLEFHLHLRGLESFALRWAENSATQRSIYAVSVSVNSSDNSVRQSVKVGDDVEISIDALSPHWMAVTLPTAASESFVLVAPASFLHAASRLWAIAWVDFYR